MIASFIHSFIRCLAILKVESAVGESHLAGLHGRHRLSCADGLLVGRPLLCGQNERSVRPATDRLRCPALDSSEAYH